MSSGCSPTRFRHVRLQPSKSQYRARFHGRDPNHQVKARCHRDRDVGAGMGRDLSKAMTRAVPLLQQRCAFRTERSGATRPEYLGLSAS